MLRAIPPTAALVLAAVVAACGGDDGRLERTTPAEKVGKPPVATPTAPPHRKRARALTQRDAERLRGVVDGWARALRQGDVDAAAKYFSLPLVVAEGTAITLERPAELRQFLDALPCGARLVKVGYSGPYVLGMFRLTERPGHQCDGPGALARVAFMVRGGKITEWRRLPDDPSAQPDPAQPDPAPTDEQQIA